MAIREKGASVPFHEYPGVIASQGLRAEVAASGASAAWIRILPRPLACSMTLCSSSAKWVLSSKGMVRIEGENH